MAVVENKINLFLFIFNYWLIGPTVQRPSSVPHGLQPVDVPTHRLTYGQAIRPNLWLAYVVAHELHARPMPLAYGL